MNKIVKITKVNKDNNSIFCILEDGIEKEFTIQFPAKINFAKLGKAEIGYNATGEVNFVKSLAQQSSQEIGHKAKYKAYNEVEISEGVTLKEFKEIYNRTNQWPMKINATNLINNRLTEGQYLMDVIYFTTRFEKINSTDNTI